MNPVKKAERGLLHLYCERLPLLLVGLIAS